ncbi:MAG: hypothetical protein GX070_07115, partial [Alcaligenaceae bacterium]|nr:hypothetical protein [Alcaligenaceae bacterium]
VMRSANLNERARQEIYAIAEQIRHMPPAPVQASSSSSRQNNSTVQGVSNLSSGQTYAEAAKKKEPVNVASASSAPPQPEADFELMVPANAPALASNIQPRPQNRPGVQVQPAAAPELVPQGQQAQARAEVQPEPAPAEPEAPRLQVTEVKPGDKLQAPAKADPLAMMQPEFKLPEPAAEAPVVAAKAQPEPVPPAPEVKPQPAPEPAEPEAPRLQVTEVKPGDKLQAPAKADPLAMMQPEFVWPTAQQLAEEKRQLELVQQQAEEKRQLELVQQQAEAQRQLELAQQQADTKRQAELVQQQAEAQRQLELAQQQAEAKHQAELAQQQADAKRQLELAQQQAEEKRQLELAQQQAEAKRLADEQRQAEEKRLATAAASKKPVAQTQAIPTARSQGSTSAIDRSILDGVSIVGGDFIIKRK